MTLALTGYGDVADRERAGQAGLSYHLTRPADPVRAVELVASLPPDGSRG